MKILKYILIIFVLAFIYLMEQIQSERMIYKIDALNEQLSTAKKECLSSAACYNELISSIKLENEAKKLKLLPPGKKNIIEINE